MKTKSARTRPPAGPNTPPPSRQDTRQSFEKRLTSRARGRIYTLRLFVTGNSPRSTAAISTIRAICDEYLRGKFELEVVDIYQQPSVAVGEQIVAAPTLIKQRPKPVRRMVGTLSDRERVLFGLDIVGPDDRQTATAAAARA